MKNEAGLRPMKRGFAARKGMGALLHASAASVSRKPQVSASRLPTENASLKGYIFTKAFIMQTTAKRNYIFLMLAHLTVHEK
jgi:hypothetical protein